MDNKTNEKMKNTVTENFEKKENVVNEGFTTAPKRGVAGIGYKILIQHEILDWIADVPFSKFYNEISKDVIGQEALKQVCANVYAYLNSIANDTMVRNNMILSAPSGSGKTETYRAIKNYFEKKIPSLSVHICDMTSITATGFKGNDTTSILAPFIKRHIDQPIGIVFMDEFDKKIIPMYDSNGTNVNGDVQASMLSMIEGGELYLNDRGIIKTDRLMFVGLGSFESFRNKRSEKKNPIGLGASWDEAKEDSYAPLTRNDMVEAGASNEIMGRFPYIINYEKLNKDSVRSIVSKLLCEIGKSFNLEELELKDEAEEEIMEIANSKYGCRLLDATIRDTVLEAYTDALVNNDVGKLSITINKLHDATYTWEPYERLSETERLVRIQEEQERFDASMVWDNRPEEYFV